MKKSKKRRPMRKIRTSPFYKKTLRKLKKRAAKKSTGRRKHRASSPRIRTKRRVTRRRSYKPRVKRSAQTFVPRIITAHYYAAGPRPGLRNVIVHTTAEPKPTITLEPKSTFRTNIEQELAAVLDREPGIIDQLVEEAVAKGDVRKSTGLKLAKQFQHAQRYGMSIEKFSRMLPVKLSVEELKFLAAERIPHAPFYWASHKKNVVLKATKMPTEHVFYALRMLFNNTVPPTFRVVVPGELFNRYDDVELKWTPAYKAQAIREFAKILSTRDDLTITMKRQLRDMVSNTKVILGLHL